MENISQGEFQLLNLLRRLESMDISLGKNLTNIQFEYLGKKYIINSQWHVWGNSLEDGAKESSITITDCDNQQKNILFEHKFKIVNYGEYESDVYNIIENDDETIKKSSFSNYEPEIKVEDTTYGNGYIKKDGYTYKLEEEQIVQYKDESDYCYYDTEKKDLIICTPTLKTTLISLKEIVSQFKTKMTELQSEIPSCGMLVVSKGRNLIKLEKEIVKYEERQKDLLTCQKTSFRNVKMKFDESLLDKIADYLEGIIENLETENTLKKLSPKEIELILKKYKEIDLLYR